MCFTGQLLFAVLASSFVVQGVELVTVQNTVLELLASDLTTNGVAGLTNTSPRLTVSWVSPRSTHLGTVSLVSTQLWVRRYDGQGYGTDTPVKVVVDAMQNVTVTGYSAGLSFGADFLTIKYASDGTPLWTNRFDGAAHLNDYARCLAVDSAGNVLVAGDSRVSGSRVDVVTIKYSSAGNLLWTSHFNRYGTNHHAPSGVAVDIAGNTYVTATSFGTEERPYITVKYDPLGNAVWTNYYRGSSYGSDFAGAVLVDESGDIVVGGSSDGVGTGLNYTILQYAPDGTSNWTNRWVGDSLAIMSSMALDPERNVIVTGDAMSSTHRYATMKLSESGLAVWTNYFPAPRYQGGNVPRVAADLAGNVFVMGGSPSADFYNADFTTVKYSPAGSALWTNRFFEVNSDNQAPGGIAVDHAGNVFLTGHSSGSGGTNVDFFTVKYASDGDAVWTNRYNGLTPSSADYPLAIAVDDAGSICVTGLSNGDGTGDYATVKYSDLARYEPPTNFVGTDNFSFVAVDPLGNSATGIVTVVVIPDALQFNTCSSNSWLGDQGMRLQVDGARGTSPVTLYASTNLVQWNPIATNVPVLGSAQFIDSAATNLPACFYRAAQQE